MVAGKFLLNLLENTFLLMGLVDGSGGRSGGCGGGGCLFVLVLAATELLFDFVLYTPLPPPSLPIVLLFQHHIYIPLKLYKINSYKLKTF